MKLYDFLSRCRELLVLLESLERRHAVMITEIRAVGATAAVDPSRTAILAGIEAEHRAASGELDRATRLLFDFDGITVCS